MTAKPFLWGTATASYQIEGAVQEDGRRPSIWDTFSHTPGKVAEGDTGDIACDHYHRWEEDLDLLKDLGASAYRFSVAWPRVLPSGTGTPNEEGLAFYDRLIDGLLARGIAPMLTCYHWDLPQTLEDRGGWRVRETPEALAAYVSLLAERFGDRVPMWCTLNEPWCSWWHGHVNGHHAPGAKETGKMVWQIAHHHLLAHGLAVRAIKAAAPGASVGIVHNPSNFVPFSEDPRHVEAGRARWKRESDWLLGTTVTGRYPEEKWNELGADVPDVADGDLEIIATPCDYVGLNVYGAPGIVHADRGLLRCEKSYPRTAMNWPVTPDAIYWTLRWAHESYGLESIHLTENGCAWPDEPDDAGRVEDVARVEYLRQYIRNVERARSEGIPVHGYFAWSLLDNFEWAWGFGRRFGLVHVDYETQKRTPKASFEWYRDVIARGGTRPETAE